MYTVLDGVGGSSFSLKRNYFNIDRPFLLFMKIKSNIVFCGRKKYFWIERVKFHDKWRCKLNIFMNKDYIFEIFRMWIQFLWWSVTNVLLIYSLFVIYLNKTYISFDKYFIIYQIQLENSIFEHSNGQYWWSLLILKGQWLTYFLIFTITGLVFLRYTAARHLRPNKFNANRPFMFFLKASDLTDGVMFTGKYSK